MKSWPRTWPRKHLGYEPNHDQSIDDLRNTKIKLPLNNGTSADACAGLRDAHSRPRSHSRVATKAAAETGGISPPRHGRSRYRTEKEVGEAMQEVFKEGYTEAAKMFSSSPSFGTRTTVPTASNQPSEASLKRLQLDFVDLYLIHTLLCLPARHRAGSRVRCLRQCNL